MEWNYEEIKKVAKRTGRKVSDFLAMATINDPFYKGSPIDIEKAQWFKDIWDRFGYEKGVHIRRIHYQLISQEQPVKMPNNKIYANTDKCFDYLNQASRAARYLNFVDASNFDDRRNEKPTINTENKYDNIDVYQQEGDYFNISLSDFPEQPSYNVIAEQQSTYLLELWCEKSTMNDVLEPFCSRYGINFTAGMGQASITQVNEMLKERAAWGKALRIFYISDFDNSGKSIPVAVARKVEYFLATADDGLDIKLEQIVLTEKQCIKYKLPKAPGEERHTKFEDQYGEGITELDALEALHPGELVKIVKSYISPYYEKNQEQTDKVEELVSDIQDQLVDIEGQIAENYEEEYDKLFGEYTRIKNEFEDRVEKISEQTKVLYSKMSNELDKEVYTMDYEPLPEHELIEESDDFLFDSNRDYLKQLNYYKKFQYDKTGYKRLPMIRTK